MNVESKPNYSDFKSKFNSNYFILKQNLNSNCFDLIQAVSVLNRASHSTQDTVQQLTKAVMKRWRCRRRGKVSRRRR